MLRMIKVWGAAIGSSDGHRMSVGRGLTAFRGDVREAINDKSTMAVMLDHGEQRAQVLMAIKLFGEERVFGKLTFAEFEQRASKIYERSTS